MQPPLYEGNEGAIHFHFALLAMSIAEELLPFSVELVLLLQTFRCADVPVLGNVGGNVF